MTAPDLHDPDALLTRIAGLQSTGGDTYARGLFPARRTHRYARAYEVEDDSVFFTAVILHVLQHVRNDLSPDSRRLVDAITKRARGNYSRYRNKQGDPIYNFWQIHPEERFFPNGGLLSRFRHFRLPEDIDTTSYIYLTQPHSEEDLRWLKERIAVDTNRNRRQIRNTLPKYRHLRAYSTWLGEANMPIDFDVCAQSNLLLAIFKHDLPLNEHDRDTLRFIRRVILEEDHLHHPFRVSPHYADPSVILYHVARLSAACDVPELNDCRCRLIRDLQRQADGTTSPIEHVLLSTSLMRLGEDPLPVTFTDALDEELDHFSFFIGGLLTAVDNPLTWALAGLDVFHLPYHCRAHALALLLEHAVYRRRHGAGA